MKEVTTVINRSLEAFLLEVQALIQDGWEIDETNPPCTWGVSYETGMVKTEETVAKVTNRLQAIIDGKPRLTRAQIMEKARAARSFNKAQEKDTENNESENSQ